jgi:carbamoyltransferase
MNILGITGFFHDTAAAILINGRLVAFVEEERFNRVKHAPQTLPEKAIEYCLQEAKLTFKDIDVMVCEHDLDLIVQHDKTMEPYKSIFAANPNLAAEHSAYYLGVKKRILDFAASKGIREVAFAPHHHTHIAAAYYGSGFDEAIILSIDGRGDSQSTMIAKGKAGDIEVLDEIPLPSSLGLLYANVTQFLGYTPFEGEGTVMGLAAFGEDKYREFFDELVGRDGHRFVVKAEASFNELFDGFCTGIQNPLVKKFGAPRAFNPDPRNGIDENIAASLQACVERAVADYVRHYIQLTGIKKLCIAGGVAMNSKMNGQLYKMLSLEDIYAFPVAGDAGCSIGGAMWCAKQLHSETISPITNIYYGPQYSDAEIDEVLKASATGLVVEVPDSIAEATASLIAKHKIVGWFQGRMEGGARALGARSILSNPGSIADKDAVNIRVKYREPWRPFAPSILHERRSRYMGTDIAAPFMTVTFDVPEDVQHEIPGAMHVDGTIRAQTVRREDNPLYYDLIEAVERKTGVAVVTNTSFNRKGEPIVNTPQQALDMFMATDMDALAIGIYLVQKKA